MCCSLTLRATNGLDETKQAFFTARLRRALLVLVCVIVMGYSMGYSKFPNPVIDQRCYFMQQSQVHLTFLCIIYSTGMLSFRKILKTFKPQIQIIAILSVEGISAHQVPSNLKPLYPVY